MTNEDVSCNKHNHHLQALAEQHVFAAALPATHDPGQTLNEDQDMQIKQHAERRVQQQATSAERAERAAPSGDRHMPTQAGSVSISRNASIAPGHEISAAQNTLDALQEASRWLAREAALAAEQQPQPRCKAAAPPQHRNSDLPRACVYIGPALAKFQEEHRLPAEELRRLEQADADGSLSNGMEVRAIS